MKLSARKSLLINKKFQLSLLLYANCLAFLVMGVFSYGVYVFFTRLNEFAKTLGDKEGQVLANFLYAQERSLFAIFAFVSICTFVLICASAMILSHRIAGPLHRLNVHLKAIASGKEHFDVKFRENDYFQELADSCNKAFKKVRS